MNPMKVLLVVVGLVAALAVSRAGYAQAWQYSPYNFNNSPSNFNNSPYNFNNSPYNFNNSPYNSQSNRGIYDNNGNRVGYGVYRPDGGMNFFDNQGNRFGYRPGQ